MFSRSVLTPTLFSALLLAALTPFGALAREPASILGCLTIADDAQRLACYDAAAQAVSAAEETRRQAPVEAFGRSGDAVAAAAGIEALDRLSANIAQVFEGPAGKLVLILDNGQQWRQSQREMLPGVKPGDAVTIKKGALGSFKLTLERIRRTIAVKRYR